MARARPSRAAKGAVLAQRRSTFGPGGSTMAPPIADAGRALDASTRTAMESGFGRDFSHIRVHNDARAHDSARALDAHAYAAGDHIVFGEGRYQPHTSGGRALIAHELAHSVQQSGVQMKANGPLPASADAELERQADRAALDLTAGRSAPTLSRIGRPAVFRAVGDPPAAPGARTPAPAGSAPDITGDPAVQEEAPKVEEEAPKGPGATFIAVAVPVLKLPLPKGAGAWVEQAYKAAAKGGSLIANPRFTGSTVPMLKEKSGESYKDLWLNNYGFTSLKEMAKAFEAAAAGDPAVKAKTEQDDVKKILKGFETNNLTNAGCDIDHIVEKQLGGASITSNLQLLLAQKNRPAGTKTYENVAALAVSFRKSRTKLTEMRIRFDDAKVAPDSPDGSFEIETLLREKPSKIKGSDDVAAKAEGVPVALLAGGKQQVTRVRASGSTPVEDSARRIIPGLKLTNYTRASATGRNKSQDTVEAEIASKPLIPSGKNIILSAMPATAPTVDDAAAGAAAADRAAASEYRQLKLDQTVNKNIAFIFPYLSPGHMTSLAFDESGLRAEAEITPSVKFLGKFKVQISPDTVKLVKDIDTAAMNSSAFVSRVSSVFRFTTGSISVDLAQFKPEGTLAFTVGPARNPVIEGEVKAGEEGGAFVATGTLKPARKIPAVKDASGTVQYNSQTGWSGTLTAKSQEGTIPKSTVEAEFGFAEAGDRIRAHGKGGLTTTVRNKTFGLTLYWDGGNVAYSGRFRWEKPFPIVESAEVDGYYNGEEMRIEGKDITFNFRDTWKGKLSLHYVKREGAAAHFYGEGSVDVETKNKKASGNINVKVDETGELTGSGTVAYQLTDKIKPSLSVILNKGNHLTIVAGVSVGTIDLFEAWPKPPNDKKTLITFGPVFKIPTPVPSVDARISVFASVGYSFYFGPGQLKNTVFFGSFDPLEEDPNISLTFTSTFAMSAGFNVVGEFGAKLGVEAGWGAVAVDGDLTITPTIGPRLGLIFPVSASYKEGDFEFKANPKIEAELHASLGISLGATISAAWGLWSHHWGYPIASIERTLGPKLVISFGELGYSTKTGPAWPDFSMISVDPKDVEPLQIMKDILSGSTDSKSENPGYDPNAKPPPGVTAA
jgi:hypothetical protein